MLFGVGAEMQDTRLVLTVNDFIDSPPCALGVDLVDDEPHAQATSVLCIPLRTLPFYSLFYVE